MKQLFFFFILFFHSFGLSAQRKNADYQRYVEQYADLAIEQMKIHRIPASITLAQAIFESGAGKSELAVKANNHFGIKKGAGWDGPVYMKADDKSDDLFRVYKNVRLSFEDHSQILLKPRYNKLFNLDIHDYKGWARGLKDCGYATNPAYADRLINLIEMYGLYVYDRQDQKYTAHNIGVKQDVKASQHSFRKVGGTNRTVVQNNGLFCVIVQPGDSWEKLAHEMNVKVKKLLKWNEAFSYTPLYVGNYVYLQKKAKKGPREMKKKWHKVSSGESMYFISQYYGVRLEKLYRMNFKSVDFVPQPGNLIKVR